MYKNKDIQNPTQGVEINFSSLSDRISSQFPIGCICPWVGGYFTDGNNGGFTNVLGNTIANVNTYISGKGFKVCDGTILNDADSPIYNGAGRYLPNLTDGRFLMGSTSIGLSGGSDTLTEHRHNYSFDNTVTTALSFTPAAHNHYITLTGVYAFLSHPHRISAGHDESYGPYGSEGKPPAYDLSTSWGNVAYLSGGTNHTVNYSTSNASMYGDISHTHPATGLSGNIGTGSPAGSTNNIPKYFNCFYIQRIK